MGFTGRLKYLCMCRGTSTAASRRLPEVDAGAIVAAAPTGRSPFRVCCATEEEDVAAPKRAVEAAEVRVAAGSPPA